MKPPAFLSYDYQPAHSDTHGTTTTKYRPSIRALGKDGTIWETFQRSDDSWAPWSKVG